MYLVLQGRCFPAQAVSLNLYSPASATLSRFVVSLGYWPIPAKLVSQIVAASKFVDLSELLSTNIPVTETESQLLFDGHVILTLAHKKPERRIDDITTWIKACSISSLFGGLQGACGGF